MLSTSRWAPAPAVTKVASTTTSIVEEAKLDEPRAAAPEAVQEQQPIASSPADTPMAAPAPEATAAPAALPAAPSDPDQEQQLVPSEPAYPSFDNGGYDGADDYAQTRDADDLFADDFEPMDEPVVEHPVAVEATPTVPTGPRNSGRGRGGRGGRGAHHNARHTAGQKPVEDAASAETAADKDEDSTTVQQQQPQRPEAVRGDRSGTGGVKKAKLTEEELTARMEAVKLNNAKREAAHARAEADAAAYQAREAQALEKRRQERQNRQQMMGEREKNRQRKLNALSGREWDATKDDNLGLEPQDRGSQYRRGAHGGIAPDPAAPTAVADDGDEPDNDNDSRVRNSGGGRGRGSRGRGRGRGRGGADGGNARGGQAQQTLPSDADFPALAPSKAAEGSEAPSQTDKPAAADGSDAALSKPMAKAGGRWAEME